MKLKRITYMTTANTVSLLNDNHEILMIHSSEKARFNRIMEAIRLGDEETLLDEFNIEGGIVKKSKGLITTDVGNFYYKDELLPPQLGNTIYQIYKRGGNYSSLVKFWEKCKLNPSEESVKDLFTFLTKNDFTITDDGDFLAYRSVSFDFRDLHTRTMDNSVGTTVRMYREDVDPDRTNTCSTGLHVASYDYARNFGSDANLVLVTVNPKDVVSVPIDYNNQKMRVCEFTVIKHIVDKKKVELDPVVKVNKLNKEKKPRKLSLKSILITELNKVNSINRNKLYGFFPEEKRNSVLKYVSYLKKNGLVRERVQGTLEIVKTIPMDISLVYVYDAKKKK